MYLIIGFLCEVFCFVDVFYSAAAIKQMCSSLYASISFSAMFKKWEQSEGDLFPVTLNSI